ncbi:MAG: hypothetical protein QOG68_2776 [Solirubrobacteraceae bacterium]|nr:hypothetical protein [Solirubrobacteraceae bacterium]
MGLVEKGPECPIGHAPAMTAARSLIVAVVLAAGLTACGGSDKTSSTAGSGSERPQVEAAFRNYLDRLAASDGSGACAAMAPALQEKMLTAMRNAGAGALVKGKTCGQVLDFIAAQSADFKKAAASLHDATITTMNFVGGKAVYQWKIVVNGQTVNNTGEAEKTGGRWLITCCVPGQ